MGTLQIIATGIVFLALGLVCLFWTRDIQRWAVEWYDRLDRAGFPQSGIFSGYVKSEFYVWVTRFLGLLCLGVGVAMIVTLIRAFGE
jgi:hypothetical protein